MEKPWGKTQSAARSTLKATKKQVEHGLELHRNLLVCDAFGFDPKLYTRRVMRSYNQRVSEGASAAFHL